MWTHEGCMASPGPKSVLTLTPGWRLDRTRSDSMRCVNLGIAWLLIGNVLWFLTRRKFDLVCPPVTEHILGPDAAPEDILYDLQRRFKRWLSGHKMTCSCRRFTLAALGVSNSESVCQYKRTAAQSPKLVSWLASLTLDFAAACPQTVNKEAHLVTSCTWGLA